MYDVWSYEKYCDGRKTFVSVDSVLGIVCSECKGALVQFRRQYRPGDEIRIALYTEVKVVAVQFKVYVPAITVAVKTVFYMLCG